MARSGFAKAAWGVLAGVSLAAAIWTESSGWWQQPHRPDISAAGNASVGTYGFVEDPILEGFVVSFSLRFMDYVPNGYMPTQNGRNIANVSPTGWLVAITAPIANTGENRIGNEMLRRVCRFIVPSGSKPYDPRGFALDAKVEDAGVWIYRAWCLQGRGQRSTSGGAEELFTVPSSVVRQVNKNDQAVSFAMISNGDVINDNATKGALYQEAVIPHRDYEIDSKKRITQAQLPSADNVLQNTDTVIQALHAEVPSPTSGFFPTPSRVFVVVSDESSRGTQHIIELIAAALFGVALDRLLTRRGHPEAHA